MGWERRESGPGDALKLRSIRAHPGNGLTLSGMAPAWFRTQEHARTIAPAWGPLWASDPPIASLLSAPSRKR
jgi:hypothetical protein